MAPNRKRASAAAALMLIGILSLAPSAPSTGKPAPAAWQENISMLVLVDGKAEGRAHLFESEDYQRMLLVLDSLGSGSAVVLDLPEATVYSAPRDSVIINDDGTAAYGEAGNTYLTALERKDGAIAFDVGEHAVLIQPLPPLIGPATYARLLELKPAYAVAAREYEPDPAMVAAIKDVKAETDIRVYFGTWCHLCKALVPALIRTIELAGNPAIRVSYIGVDEDMKEPAGDLKQDHVTKTPTVIVLQRGREIGRIEEKPATTIEGDLAGIVSQR